MDKFRNWLMGVVAGRRFAYWISDKARNQIENLHSVAGVGAAIILVDMARKDGFEEIKISLEGWAVTVKEEAAP